MRPPDAYQRARLEPTAKGDTTMGRTVPDTATDASAPELRAAGPGDLDAVVDLLTGVFLDDPLMSAIAAAAPDPRAAQCEAHRPAEPHWYLYMVAVAPAARGRGIGGRLLGHGLKRVDAEGLPAHLESTTPGSRRLYERFGFRQVAELAGSGLPVYWAMTRPARTGGRRGADSIDDPASPGGPAAPTGPVPTPR